MNPVNTSSAAQTGWSINTRLTIDLIREHTKTTDVAHVTDNQLEHYRATAVEQCELYTGLIIGAPRFIQEQVPAKTSRFRAKSVPYRTKHPTTDGLVYYRSSSGLTGMTRIEPGTRKVEVPVHVSGVLGGNMAAWCCDSCSIGGGGGAGGSGSGLTLSYNAGYCSPDEIPAGLILGMLKFIAWSVEHAGDMLITMANSTAERDSGIIGTNNGLWASGALDLFRAYKVGGF
jgi:hypothetical protein